MPNIKVAGPQRIPTTPSNTARNTAKTSPTSMVSTPAVPMSIYRELSADLQTTQSAMVALKHHNQQLVQQNQWLKQELERIANRTQQTVKHLETLQGQSVTAPTAGKPVAIGHQSLANPGQFHPDSVHPGQFELNGQPEINSDVLVEDYIEELPIVPEQFYRSIPDEVADSADAVAFSLPQLPKPKLVYEQALRKPIAQLSDASVEMPAWKMSAVIALIICSAFGAGFLIVRPLLSK